MQLRLSLRLTSQQNIVVNSCCQQNIPPRGQVSLVFGDVTHTDTNAPSLPNNLVWQSPYQSLSVCLPFWKLVSHLRVNAVNYLFVLPSLSKLTHNEICVVL